MSGQPVRAERSVFRTLALWLTAIPALLFVLIAALSIWQTDHALRAEILNQINDDVAALARIHIQDGRRGVSEAIEQRLILSPLDRDEAVYVYSTREGDMLAGNLDPSRMGQPRMDVPIYLTAEDGTTLLARATQFRIGDRLLVGRTTRSIARTRERNLIGFVVGLVILLGASALFIRATTQRLRARVAQMNAVMDQVSDGHLAARIGEPVGLSDEIDQLGIGIDQTIARAERLLAARKRVTDELAHEIRSPLTRLDAQLADLNERPEAPQGIAATRRRITDCIALLDGLLDMSSIDAQDGDRRTFEVFDLMQTAHSVAELFDPLAEEKGGSVIAETGEAVLVSGDRSQIGRLVANLVDNAVKYADPETDINIELTSRNGQATLRVANTGPRIPADMAQNVFVPFFRHHELTDRQGHGLGLALCSSIAKRHGGSLTVEPDTKRTVFRFEMPILSRS